MDTIINTIYTSTGFLSVDSIHSHNLSVFFVLMATGLLFDSYPSALILAQEYHALSRAALSLDSVLVEANCATVQAVFMIVRFIHLLDGRGEERYMLGGVCERVAKIVWQHLL
jgi:hypothetical protein